MKVCEYVVCFNLCGDSLVFVQLSGQKGTFSDSNDSCVCPVVFPSLNGSSSQESYSFHYAAPRTIVSSSFVGTPYTVNYLQ